MSLMHALDLSSSFWCYIPICEFQYLKFAIIDEEQRRILGPPNTKLIIPVDKLIVLI